MATSRSDLNVQAIYYPGEEKITREGRALSTEHFQWPKREDSGMKSTIELGSLLFKLNTLCMLYQPSQILQILHKGSYFYFPISLVSHFYCCLILSAWSPGVRDEQKRIEISHHCTIILDTITAHS